MRRLQLQLARGDGEDVGGDAGVKLGRALERVDGIVLEKPAHGIEQLGDGGSILHARRGTPDGARSPILEARCVAACWQSRQPLRRRRPQPAPAVSTSGFGRVERMCFEERDHFAGELLRLLDRRQVAALGDGAQDGAARCGRGSARRGRAG